ncbi:MAG: glycosyltransferase [Candidatus Bathyarchaeota archaeon]|nr:glycosyltransferase [Candidatus Bathyarchaeota archaeon]
MVILLAVWIIVGLLFFGVPGSYFLYMKKRSVASWNLNINADYVPSTAVLIPVFNEEKIIRLKLENLAKVTYPKDKMEIIIVNDCSSDGTLSEVNRYIAANPLPKITVFDSKVHLGKTACLNKALKTVTAEVVILSDADCFWPHDILNKALTYLSDPNVGAITGREFLLNPTATWVTLGEQFYDQNIQAIRIGESKVHSTLFFQGGFAAFKRSILEEFNHATDDSGTALDIIQKNQRALLIPDTGFFTLSPTVYRNKISIKIRRASHLQKLCARCLKLFLQGKLAFPKRIALPEIYLHIFSPLFLVAFLILSVAVMVMYPSLGGILILGVAVLLVVKKTRTTALELLQNNLILLTALTSFILNRKFRAWRPIEESRFGLNEQLLREQKLI